MRIENFANKDKEQQKRQALYEANFNDAVKAYWQDPLENCMRQALKILNIAEILTK